MPKRRKTRATPKPTPPTASGQTPKIWQPVAVAYGRVEITRRWLLKLVIDDIDTYLEFATTTHPADSASGGRS